MLAVPLASLFAAAAATGQRVPPAPPRFSVETSLVEVYATVTDRSGRLVGGLGASDFTVLEDGVRQEVTAFSAGGGSLSVALAVDRSFSMRGERLATVRRSAAAFLDRLRPEDRVTVLAVGSQVEVVAPMGTDRRLALGALGRLEAWGTTPLFDAVVEGLACLATERGRRALVLVTDGDDRFSQIGADEVIERARRSGSLVYPLTLGRSPSVALQQVARVTGARSLDALAAGPVRTLASIADELRAQYVLGYEPSRPLVPGRGEWRAIRVAVEGSGLAVRARDGYFAR